MNNQNTSKTRSGSAPTVRLWLMMVLEFAIWGAWLPLVWGYMGKDGLAFSEAQIAWVGSTFAIASIVGIFFSSQFADRTFAAEKFMAASHLIGGLAILALYWAKEIAAATGLGVFPVFFGLMLVHALLYVPTISVSNSIAFTHMQNAQKEFGLVRMGGTIGWILAAWPLYFVLQGKEGAAAVAASRNIFLVSGITSLVLAAYSLLLPHTPPKRVPAATGAAGIAWLKAAGYLSHPYLLVLFLVTFVDAVIHNGYFVMAGGFLGSDTVGIKPEWIMPVMSIGQVAEILTMAVLGAVLARLGWKTTMILGILGHAARFGVFAFLPQNQTVIILVQVLHGICYAFFFATLYIFIDAAFPKDVRASAQSLFNLLVLGLGDLAAKWLFIPLQASLTAADGAVDYRRLFLVPAVMALAAAAVLLVAFWPPRWLATGAQVEDDPETEPQLVT
ncbi:MAG: MFS transporter [Planctomycetes bacterium]|nr:MFS transporter [Planctomycetota bacterium]